MNFLLKGLLQNVFSKKDRSKKVKKENFIPEKKKDTVSTETTTTTVKPKTRAIPRRSAIVPLPSAASGVKSGGLIRYDGLSEVLNGLIKNTAILSLIAKNNYESEKERDKQARIALERESQISKEENAEAKRQIKENKSERKKVEFGIATMFKGFLKRLIFATAVMEFIDFIGNPERSGGIYKFLEDNFVAVFISAISTIAVFALAPLIGPGSLMMGALSLLGKIAITLGSIVFAFVRSLIANPVALGALSFSAGDWLPLLFPGLVNAQERKTYSILIEKYQGDRKRMIADLKKERDSIGFLDPFGRKAEIDEQIRFLETGKTTSYGAAPGSRVELNTGVIPKVPGMPQQPEPQSSSATQAMARAVVPALPPTGTIHGQAYGASRSGGRRHAGTDFDISGNETFYSRIGGVVTNIGNDPGGYGKYVDIYNSDLNRTERIAEGRDVLVSRGDMVSAGQPVVRGETETGVIHYEIRKGKKTTFGYQGTEDPVAFLKKIRYTEGVSKQAPYESGSPQYIMIPMKQPPMEPRRVSGGSGIVSGSSVKSDVNSYYKQTVLGMRYRQ